MSSMAKRSSYLEIVFTDFDPLVCDAAQCSFATVLEAHPAAALRVKVIQGNMLAAIPRDAKAGHMKAAGYDDYLTGLGYSSNQKDKLIGMGSGRCTEPMLLWDSLTGPTCAASNNNAAGSSGSSFVLSSVENNAQPYSTPIDDARTFILYGANSAGVACGNAQTSISKTFPVQFKEIHSQILQEQQADGEDDLWPLDKEGHIYASSSEPDLDGEVSLLAAVVFPRAHDEYRNVQDVFTNALRMAVASGACSKGCVPGTVRVITHALGTFTGHPDPPQFAKSMAEGLADFLKDGIL